jgi:hypothetical protein
MGKIIAWLVLIFVVLLALRMINARNTRLRRAAAAQGAPDKADAQPMVRCTRCGVFLPRVEAKAITSGGYACADGQCSKR